MANHYSKQNILDMLRARNGKPDPSWDEDDLEAFDEIRECLELALTLKKSKTN